LQAIHEGNHYKIDADVYQLISRPAGMPKPPNGTF